MWFVKQYKNKYTSSRENGSTSDTYVVTRILRPSELLVTGMQKYIASLEIPPLVQKHFKKK